MSRAQAGYTIIEVMTAVVVMTIGAAGILAMQGASVHSNQDAAETTTAVTFATTWMERLKRDALRWNAVGSAALNNTRYLNMVTTNEGAWFVPASMAETVSGEDFYESAAADFFGFDTFPAAGNARYCVNVRLTVLHAFDGSTGGTKATDIDAIRADLRVWWHRSADDVNRATPTCTTTKKNDLAPVLPVEARIRRQYLSTVLTWRGGR